MIAVRKGTPGDLNQCVDVLAQLPGYFTLETHEEVRRDWTQHPAWVATCDDDVVGFVLVCRRYPTTAEITFAAVLPDHQGVGVGRRLVDTVFEQLVDEGVVLVEVKTLDASAGYEPYAATRAFWERRGFHQVDCIDPLPGWQPGNPSAIYVAALTATRHVPHDALDNAP